MILAVVAAANGHAIEPYGYGLNRLALNKAPLSLSGYEGHLDGHHYGLKGLPVSTLSYGAHKPTVYQINDPIGHYGHHVSHHLGHKYVPAVKSYDNIYNYNPVVYSGYKGLPLVSDYKPIVEPKYESSHYSTY